PCRGLRSALPGNRARDLRRGDDAPCGYGVRAFRPPVRGELSRTAPLISGPAPIPAGIAPDRSLKAGRVAGGAVMTDAIRPRPGIMDIALYEGGAAHVAGITDAVKLSSNENPFGPSEKAKEAYLRAVHQLHRYPSTDHARLRQAIGEVHGLDPARIICGVGSDEVIGLLCHAYAGP